MGLHYSDWIQDPNYTREDVSSAFAFDVFDPHDASVASYSDPGTPNAPPISTSRLDSLLNDVNADATPFASVSSGPYGVVADQQGGLFGGPTVYAAWKRHTPIFITLSRKLGYAADPDLTGWDGFEYEDGSQLATLVNLSLAAVTIHDDQTNCAGGSWSMRWKAHVNPHPQAAFSLTVPVWDAETWAAGTDIFDIPSGTVPGSSYVSHPLTSAVDLTPFAAGPNYEVIVQYANDLIAHPSSYSVADERPYTVGTAFSLGDWGGVGGGLVATLRPPRYRLFRSVTVAPPCQIYPRDDDQGVGSAAIWPPPSSDQPGTYY